MDVQIKNFKREIMIVDIQRKRESSELQENYMKISDDLDVANEKIKKFKEIKVKSYY